MNNEICIWCGAKMGNSQHDMEYKGKRYPIHQKCYWENEIGLINLKLETTQIKSSKAQEKSK